MYHKTANMYIFLPIKTTAGVDVDIEISISAVYI